MIHTWNLRTGDLRKGRMALVYGVFIVGMICAPSMAEEKKSGDATSSKSVKPASSEGVKPASLEKVELPAPSKEVQDALLRLHNEARARQGLAPLKTHPQLTAAAQRFAEYVHRTGRFGHYSDGRSPNQRIMAEGYGIASWAENMAWSQGTAEGAMSTWMNSGGHRGNILSGHSQVGFGHVGTVWVTVFANPSGNAEVTQIAESGAR